MLLPEKPYPSWFQFYSKIQVNLTVYLIFTLLLKDKRLKAIDFILLIVVVSIEKVSHLD